jgi:xanthine dehydrogenase accessory factor
MRDILDQVKAWLDDGDHLALATVIKTWGSSPRKVGAGMAINQDGKMVGSVSGGCVEGAVIQEALEVIQTQKPLKLNFGVTDDEAWDVGLACGGEIEIFIRPFTMNDAMIWIKALETKKAFSSALMLGGVEGMKSQEIIFFNQELNRKDDPGLSRTLLEKLSGLGEDRRPRVFQDEDGREYFIQYIPSPPKLILVGGVHITISLANMAKMLGYEIYVIDPRRIFGTEERFPDVNLIQKWPTKAFEEITITSSTAIVMLTHDPKIDDPALMIALESPAFYIGALGSMKTHQKRLERLENAGLSKEKLSRIHAPVGLDLGGGSPEEIALSVMAEIVKVGNSSGLEIDSRGG